MRERESRKHVRPSRRGLRQLKGKRMAAGGVSLSLCGGVHNPPSSLSLSLFLWRRCASNGLARALIHTQGRYIWRGTGRASSRVCVCVRSRFQRLPSSKAPAGDGNAALSFFSFLSLLLCVSVIDTRPVARLAEKEKKTVPSRLFDSQCPSRVIRGREAERS